MTTEKKNGGTIKIEVILIFLFFICFIVWAMAKCNATAAEMRGETEEDTAAVDSSVVVVDSTLINATPIAGTSTSAVDTSAIKGAIPASPIAATDPGLAKLFVVIDSLRLRQSPGLKSSTIGRLRLYDEVLFMNEVTDSLSKISLGNSIAEEPWVKVKTKNGTVGWVFGAGINYYKKKREGVY